MDEKPNVEREFALLALWSAVAGAQFWLLPWFMVGRITALIIMFVNVALLVTIIWRGWRTYYTIATHPNWSDSQRSYMHILAFVVFLASLIIPLVVFENISLVPEHSEGPDGSTQLSIIAVLLIVLALCAHEARKQFKNTPPAIQQPEATYLTWIENHVPSLPLDAKRAYLDVAKTVVLQYYEQRIAPTNDPLLIARRDRENVRPIAEVQQMVFEGYKKLASRRTVNELPAFALQPPDDTILEFVEETDHLKPWGYVPGTHDALAEYDEAVQTSPFAPVFVKL